MHKMYIAQKGSIPLPVITGAMGGVFVVDNSGVIDPATGEINKPISGGGEYIVNYTSPGFCPILVSDTVVIENPNATITLVTPFCVNDAPINLIPANLGGVWRGIGITDTIAGIFNPGEASVGTQSITYAVNTSQCSDVDTIEIVVNPLP